MTRKKHLTGKKFLRQATGAVAKLAAGARAPRNGRRHPAAAGKPAVEQLEGRQLMSADAGIDDRSLWIVGDDARPNLLTARLSDDGTSVVVNANGAISYHAVNAISSIRVRGGDRAGDVIYVDPALTQPLHIMSGDGRDTVYAREGVRRGDYADAVGFASQGERAVAALERQARGDDSGSGSGSGSDGDGTSAAPRTRVANFSLINADTNEVITDFETLGDGVTLNLATLPTRHLNIRANLVGDRGGSVLFSLNGATRVENAVPYATASDTDGDFFNWTPGAGTYTLTATPFAKDHAKGARGGTTTLTFKVINGGDAGQSPAPTPSPRPEPDIDTGGQTPRDDTDDPRAPDAVIDMITRSIEAGHALHVNAIKSVLTSGDALSARYAWDFGDAGSKYNTLVGYNAAHFYEKAGTYTITLRVTNADGFTAVATQTVTVKPSTRRVIYVSQDGNDWNTGFSPDDAIKSWDRARAMVSDDTEIRFRRGDRWDVTERFHLNATNVVLASYGTGELPVFRFVDDPSHDAILSTKGGTNVTIRDVRLDSNDETGESLYGVVVGGTNVTVLDVEFGRIGYAIQTNAIPRGLLVQGNEATETLRSYFAWVQGTDHVYLGNRAELKTDNGHVLRVGGAERVLIAYNDFKKLADGPGVTQRGTLTLHVGKHLYVVGNTLTNGKVTTGPLSNHNVSPTRLKSDRMEWVVMEDNRINSIVILESGTTHVSMRNNLITKDRGMAIEIQGYDGFWDRSVEDVYLVNNTVINEGETGNFLKVWRNVKGVTVTGNLYIADNMEFGERDGAVIVVCDTGTSAFRSICGNVWPTASGEAVEDGGMIYVGPEKTNTAQALLTPDEWESLQFVTGDVFEDVELSSRYQVTMGEVTAGCNFRLAA